MQTDLTTGFAGFSRHFMCILAKYIPIELCEKSKQIFAQKKGSNLCPIPFCYVIIETVPFAAGFDQDFPSNYQHHI